MKRMIKAAKSSSHSNYEFYIDFNIGSRKYGAHYNAHDDILTDGYVTSYHPYDDAEYTWAKISGPQVTFMRDGKVLDKMTIADYDDEWFEDFEDYAESTFRDIAIEIDNFDKDVKPIMVHN